MQGQPPRDPAMRVVLGSLLGWVVWLWLRTLRLTIVDRTGDAAASERPWVLTFWHGTQVPLLAWRRRRTTAVMVSLSRDGALQARVMERAGMRVVRGSTSRGAVRALAAMVRALRGQAHDAAFAIDGPRGPRGVVQPGAIACAKHVGGVLVPIGSAAAPARVLTRTWDRFTLPLPFARAVVVIGPALPADTDEATLARAVDDVNETAQRSLHAKPR